MLTSEQIKNNKERFIEILQTINRPGSDIKALINKLECSDFFVAPASTQYHCGYQGGLCEHSLNVYDQLVMLVKNNNVENITMESIAIVALLHDFSKMNFYEIAERNVKDENGNWTKVPYIKVRDAKDRFVYSTHGANSEYMVGRFIPLSIDESVAIINHMGGMDAGSVSNFDGGLSQIYNKYPLAILLHCADMLATFYTERIV